MGPTDMIRRLALSLAILLGSHTLLSGQCPPEETPILHLVVVPTPMGDPKDMEPSLGMNALDADPPLWTEGSFWHTQLNQPTMVESLHLELGH